MVVSYYCPTGVAAVVLAAGVADLPAAAASAAAFNFAAASAFASLFPDMGKIRAEVRSCRAAQHDDGCLLLVSVSDF